MENIEDNEEKISLEIVDNEINEEVEKELEEKSIEKPKKSKKDRSQAQIEAYEKANY